MRYRNTLVAYDTHAKEYQLALAQNRNALRAMLDECNVRPDVLSPILLTP